MERIKERLKILRDNALEFWMKMTKRQKMVLAGGAGAFALILAGLVVYALIVGGTTTYEPLFTNLEQEDAAAIVAQLKKEQIKYRIEENGKAILVPAREVVEKRLSFAEQGIPGGGTVGYELFDATKLGVTDFQQKVNLRRAIEGELSRTIMGLEAVENARVMVVQPEESLFQVEQKPASASVALKIREGKKLEQEQVRGIVHLVAFSVEGLKPENITVVNQKGEILSDFDEREKLNEKMRLSELQLRHKKQIEDIYEKKILTALSKVFGEENVVVVVSAELDYDVHTKENEVYQPVVGDSGIVRSEQLIEEKYLGTGSVPEIGVPGTTSNIPGYKGLAEGNAEYNRNEETRNYEITRLLDKIEKNQGDIRRISVSVMINDTIVRKNEEGQDERYLNERRRAQIEDNVKAAANLDEARGDEAKVILLSFTDKPNYYQEEYERQKFWDSVKRWTTYILVPIALLLMFLLSWVALRASVVKEEIPEELELPEELEEPVSVEELLIPELTDEQRRREQIKEEVLRMIHDDPEGSALIVRSWLFDDDKSE